MGPMEENQTHGNCLGVGVRDKYPVFFLGLVGCPNFEISVTNWEKSMQMETHWSPED